MDGATLDDLDPEAILKAHELYATKHEKLAEEMKTWDDETFLNKAKITIKGKITNTAVLLLCRSESEFSYHLPWHASGGFIRIPQAMNVIFPSKHAPLILTKICSDFEFVKKNEEVKIVLTSSFSVF